MYLLSVDWLQVYCLSNLCEIPANIAGEYGQYVVKESGIHTPMWQEVYEIYYMGREFATLCRCPRSSALDKFAATIKLHNRVLYSKSWIRVLKDVIACLGCRYVGVTRLDIAYDCNNLANGRSVQDFLSAYMSHAPMSEGHIIRSGSRRVTVQATRDKYGCTAISGMRWGSPSNDVGAYCYNKSLELLEVKDKPWIRDAWEAAGLVNVWSKAQWEELSEKKRKMLTESGDSSEYVQTPVWRFELSIKGHGKDLLNLSTGELFRIDLDFLDSMDRVAELWQWYAAKYFDFRINRGGVKTLRNYDKYKIFETNDVVDVRPTRVNLYADTGRTEKICANLLDKMSAEYSDLSVGEQESIRSVLAFLRTVSGAKAGIVRLKKEMSYLNHIRGYRSKTDWVRFYLDYVNYVHSHRLSCDTSSAYTFCQSLEAAVIEEDVRAMSGYTSDKSPVW